MKELISSRCKDMYYYITVPFVAAYLHNLTFILFVFSRNLTWRDVQYITVLAAAPDGLEADDWLVNGAGYKVSHHFGFGLMNAEKMVDLAANWTTLPEQRVCEVVSMKRNM